MTCGTLATIRLCSRALQLAFSVVALATTLAGFKSSDSSYGISVFIGNGKTIFAILMTYTAVLYSLWFVFALQVFWVFGRPQRLVVQVIDAHMALLLLISAVLLTNAQYVDHCDDYNTPLDCGTIKTGVVFSYMAMAAFLVTFGLGFFDETSIVTQNQYVAETRTPAVAIRSPFGSPVETNV